MKKALITFAICFTVLFLIMASQAIPAALTWAAVAESPAFTLGRPGKMDKSRRSGRSWYTIPYTYVVDGKSHQLPYRTDDLDTARLAEAGMVEIAYERLRPANAIFKSRLDNPEAEDSLSGAIGIALLASAVVSGLVAGLGWLFGSRSRTKKAMLRNRNRK